MAFVKSLHEFPNLKLCVASRPWNVFEMAFGQDATNKIYMQDLNATDIKKYVKDNLEEHPKFQILRMDNKEAQELVLEIVEKANGFFYGYILRSNF